MGGGMRCGAFSLLFASYYRIAIVSNFTVTIVFALAANKRTIHPNPPLIRMDINVNDVNEVGCGHYGGEVFRRNEPIYSCDVSRLQVVDNMVNASAQVGGVVKELMRHWGYVGTHGVLRTLLRYVLVLRKLAMSCIDDILSFQNEITYVSKYGLRRTKRDAVGVLRDEEGVARSLFSGPIDAVASETTENLLIGIDRCINQLVSIHFILVYRQGSIYAGVGSVLRNHEGLVRGVFYRQFAALNPAKVELMVVSIALHLFCSSPWTGKTHLITEIDSLNFVK
ncbi:hypothetical protein Golob_022265 [Gossypium lobatum]|uniref:Uncharacterized protein n=1 Tax=Gossypium lobatum TaxID=34289 RepID=A0A7J8LG09_9ROSI|nr:hypothetical protein [Gossypium lobatum]